MDLSDTERKYLRLLARQPGFPVDGRVARVLERRGLAERTLWGPLIVSEAGRQALGGGEAA